MTNSKHTNDTLRFLLPLRGAWCWLLAFIGMFSPSLFATHNMGADISYRCLGNNQYEITATYYRDCGGTIAPASLPIAFSSAGCSVTSTSVNTPQVAALSGIEVSPLCGASISQSSCNNTAANALPGVEVYVYRTTITLPQACADWVVSYSDCCRNNTITNLAPNGGSIYVAATINNTNGFCNNSPTFTSRPVPYICAGQPYSFNHGAVDVDGDSLYYRIINPLESATLPINFGAGLSTGYPINTIPANTFNFNNQTGQMSFTPAGNQVAVLAMMVYEIRNGDTIGRTMRDIQMVVINGCTNGAINNPQNPQVNLGGSFDTTSRSFIVCQGETLYFTMSARDPNPTDTLDYDYVNTNLLQVFGAGNFSLFPPTYPIAGRFDTADFIIAVTPPSPGLYQFVIGLTDKACPIPSTPTFGFNVVVPGVEIEARDTVLCPGIAQAIPLRARTVSSALSTVPGTIGWTQISGVTSPLNPLTGGNVTASIPASTVNGNIIQYEVTYTTIPDPSTGTTCVTRDTVNVNMMTLPLSVIMTVSDTTFCANGTANPLALNTRVTGPGVDTVNGIYTWTSIPAGFTGMLSNTNTAAPSGNITGTTPGLDFSYAVQYQYGACIGNDTQAFHFNPGVVVTTPTTISACPGDTVQLRGYLSDTNIVRLPVLCSDYDVSTIPYVTISGTGTSTGATGDDGVSGALNIGFPFVFMCDTFTQFKATTNGYITLGTTLVAPAPWTPAPIPAASSPNAYIALAWDDLTVGAANQINYFVTGTAPNRRLVINYINVAHRLGGGVPLTGQIILHEGTNYVDLMTTIYTHDGSNTVQGIENRAGTIGYAAPGRNGTAWSATNSGVRFQPRIAFSFDPITYAWSPTPGLNASTITNPTLIVQSAGLYTVTVSEGTCAQTGTIQVNVNSALTIPTITCNQSIVANTATQIGFSWTGSPGAIGWEYSIDSGRTWITNPLADSFAIVSNRLNGSCLQIYVRPVGGASACPRNAAATFTCCTDPCAITINATPSHISCAGRTDGAVQTIATGGTTGAPYTLNLFNATTSVQIGSSVISNGTATLGSNLPVGVYIVRGQDAFGCTGTSASVTITEPTVLNAAFVSLTNAACFNTATGSATASASGATAPYTYTWTSTAQTTAMVTGLAAGTYNVTVTDARGCVDTLANIIIRNPFAQAPVASLATTNSTSCPTGNGTAAVQVVQNMTGSPASFGYAWSSGQNGTGVSSVSGLGAGSYRVTITDANGCTVTNSFTLTGATVLINGFSNDNPDCGISNGSVSVSATNGTAPYSYQWSANANGQNTQTINNLGSGTYSVTVTDANGCRANGTVMLDANSVQLVISNREDRVVCFGDATGFIDITATANGNTSNPISYLWSSGQTTADISGLVAGTYTLTASIQSGTTSCPSTISMVVRQPAAALNASAMITRNLDCTGQPVGALNASAAGGWGANTYVWSNGISSNDLNNLAAGTYTVTTTDAEGCKDTASIVLVQPAIAPLNAYISVTGQTSAVTLQNVTGIVLSGGVTAGSGVTYSWSPSTNVAAPNSLNTTVDALTAGNFVYIIKAQTTDCQTLDTVNLEVIAAALRGMPSAFTPDGDGSNDFFRPVQASNLVVTQFKIFNRWGQLLYDNPQGYLTGWDGTHNGQPQPRDGYIYVFEYRLPTETNVTSLRGEFTLIR